MSSSAHIYLEKQRRFGFGGKGWTFVCGSFFSLGYIKYKERTSRSVTPYDGINEKGVDLFPRESLPSQVNQAVDSMLIIRQFCRDNARPVAYGICTVVMGIWFTRAYGAFNRLMVNRYSDFYYQIRRPDLINVKVNAIKYLLVPGLIVPIMGAGLVYSFHARQSRDRKSVIYPEFDARARAMAQKIIMSGREIAEGKIQTLKESSIAQFARNVREIKGEANPIERDVPDLAKLTEKILTKF